MNSREAGHDINVQGVWSLNVTGRGVVVAVVDDGQFHTTVTSPLSSFAPLIMIAALFYVF